MITIIVHNHYTGEDKHYEISKMYDFAKLTADFGSHINAVIHDAKNIRNAAEMIQSYLANGHLDVDIVDPEDHEHIYDPNVENTEKQQKGPKSAIDLKDVLESYDKADHVEIPEMHILDSATHRWEK